METGFGSMNGIIARQRPQVRVAPRSYQPKFASALPAQTVCPQDFPEMVTVS